MMCADVCTCGHVCACGYTCALAGTWRSEDTLGCYLVCDKVNVSYSCVIQVIWPVSSGDSPVSASSLVIGTLGLYMCAAESGFVWFPGIETHSGPCDPMASTVPTKPSISLAL